MVYVFMEYYFSISQFIADHLTWFFGWPPSCFTFCGKCWRNKVSACVIITVRNYIYELLFNALKTKMNLIYI